MAIGVTEADHRKWVHSSVWTGEYDANAIPLLITDSLGVGDKVDDDWLRDVFAAEVAAKRAAEQTWPAVTDWDRLDRAFRALERQGVIALHMAGFTQSDGLEEVEDDYEEAGGKKSNYTGHCFYTEQDQKSALDGALHVHWVRPPVWGRREGHRGRPPAAGRAGGRRAERRMERHNQVPAIRQGLPLAASRPIDPSLQLTRGHPGSAVENWFLRGPFDEGIVILA